MGWFDSISQIGKSAMNSVQGLGKSVGNTVRSIGKSGLAAGTAVSNVLDTAVTSVKSVAGEAAAIPIFGPLLQGAMRSPLGLEISAIFNTIDSANNALKDAVSIGTKINQFVDDVSAMSGEDLKDPAKRDAMATRIININNDVQNSEVGKKVSSLPVFKKQVQKFNDVSNKIQNKLGSETVQRIKTEMRS